MRTFLIAALLSCVLLPQTHINAQSSGVEIVFPQNGTTDIELSPEITIRTLYPIIPESITYGYPDVPGGGMAVAEPSVSLIEQVPPESLHHRIRPVFGTYELDNGTTLVFRPKNLKPNTTYRATVSGLVLDVNGGQIHPPISVEFTTRADVLKLRDCSLNGLPLLGCNEPITLRFNGSIQRDFHRISQLLHVACSDTGAWFAPPIRIEPTSDFTAVNIFCEGGWMPGAGIRLKVMLNEFTGDPFDEHVYSTVVRKNSKLNVSARELNGNELADDLSDYYRSLSQVISGGTRIVIPPIDRKEDLYHFVRWEGDVLPTSDGSLEIDIPCDELRDETNVVAVIERVDSLVVEVQHSTGGSVRVINHNGEFTRTISATENVVVHRDSSNMKLVAVADSGYKFLAWVNPLNNQTVSTSPVMIITPNNIQYANTNTAPTVVFPFNPRWGQVGPTAEEYKLKAHIQDVEPRRGFDVTDAVFFTTESYFEDDVESSRSVCVRAQPCWEIVGLIEPLTGTRQYFDGKEEYCYVASLKDPINEITFLAQRKYIDFRAERVLIASDNYQDVVIGKAPPPEVLFAVDLEEEAFNGVKYYRPLHANTCQTDGITFNRYQLQCGDKIRIRCRGNYMRGTPWKYFAPELGYVMPVPGPDHALEKTYEIVLDNDIAVFAGTNCWGNSTDVPEVRVRGCFLQQFGIEAIGITTRVLTGEGRNSWRFEERWLDPQLYRRLASDEPFGGRQLEYVPMQGCILKVKYTLPVDIRTITSGGMVAESYDNFLIGGGTQKNLDFSVASSDDSHISYEPVDGSPITTVVFHVNDPQTSPRLQALHGGSVSLTTKNSITSLSGIPLQATFRFHLQGVELPGYGIQLRTIEYEHDGDNDVWFIENSGDTYHAVYGGDLGSNYAEVIDQGFKRIPDCSEQQGATPGECTLLHSDKDGPQQFGDMMLWLQPHFMDRQDLAWLMISSYDEDCKDEGDCLVNRVQDLLDDLEERADGYSSNDRKNPLDWNDIIGDLVGVGAQFITALLPPDDQDEFLGTGTFLESSAHWWGLRSGTGTNVTLNHPNAKYRLLIRPFFTKSVIR